MANDIISIKERIKELGSKNYDLVYEVGHTVWSYAELARNEYKSAFFLTRKLESLGFTVEYGIAGFPTGFIASYSNGEGPTIGLLCEYDCLPGLSSTTPGAPGHGCGHCLYAAGAVGSAYLLKSIMEEADVKGTIKVFGTPAEENLGAKQFYVRQGIFNGVDAVFSTHPHIYNGVFYAAHNAIIAKQYRFYGSPSHAGSMPEKGRSALDALELFNIGIQFLREHVTPDVRMHYLITNSGQAPNIVPAYAEGTYLMRAQQADALADVARRVELIAQGAAMMTETRVESEFLHQYANVILNRAFTEIAYKNVLFTGPAEYDEEDQRTAREMGFKGIDPELTPLPLVQGFHGGASDEGDVSWHVPMTRICMRTNPAETPNHSVIRAKQADLPAAYKAITQTCKAVACTAIDLLLCPDFLQKVKDDFVKAINGREYPSDGMLYPKISTFPDAPGFSLTAKDELTVCLKDTVLLQDKNNVELKVFADSQCIGSCIVKDADVPTKIALKAAVKSGDVLTIYYSQNGKNVLLGYFQHAIG